MSRPVVVSDTATAAVLAFCAVLPFTGSPAGWALVLAAVGLDVLARRQYLPQVWVPVPVLALVAWTVLSLLWSVEPGKTANDLVLYLLFVLLGLLVVVGRTLDDLLTLFVRAATALLVGGWVAVVAVPSVGRMTDTQYVGAVRGLFAEKNGLGYFAVLTCISAALWALGPTGRSTHPWVRWMPSALGLLTVLGCQSRTALGVLLALIGALAVIRLVERSRPPRALAASAWLGAVALAVVGVWAAWTPLLALLGRDPTLTGRTHIWYVVQQAIWERPLTGYGWKALWIDGSPTTEHLWQLHYGVPFYHAHNGYLDLAAQLGLVGLGLSVVLLGTILVSGITSWVQAPSAIGLWPVLVCLLVLLYNLTEVVSFTNTTWILLVAIAADLSRRRKGAICTSPMQHGFSPAACPYCSSHSSSAASLATS